jgi:hypothetical protein
MRHRVVIAVILAALLSAAAQAGWLVLRTGVAFETAGPWKVQNNWLNFTDKTVHNTGTKTARRQRAVNQVVGGLNMILYCMNSYADDEKKFDDCVKNLKF